MDRNKILMCIKRGILWISILFFVLFVIIGIINIKMVRDVEKRIVYKEEVRNIKNVKYIAVLGALVRSDGSLSLMLKDRMDRALEVFDDFKAEYLILTGDGKAKYSETSAMSDYAVKYGVGGESIIIDNEGYSTYESVDNIKKMINNGDKVIFISQKYHLYRTLFIAKELGIDAYGVAAEGDTYYGQFIREIREVLARVKDFGKVLFK